MSKITVHKGLSELKILADRIEDAIIETNFCISSKPKARIKGQPQEEYCKIMQGGYDKINDLIRREEEIKSAINVSNSNTKVTIAGKEYTVVEAINVKNNIIPRKMMLLNEMKTQYNKTQKEIEVANRQVEKELKELIQKSVEKDTAKQDETSESITSMSETYIGMNALVLIDPICILKKIEKLENEISDFKSEVDSALSVSNALTFIEID